MPEVIVYELDGLQHVFTTSQSEFFFDPDSGVAAYEVPAPSVITYVAVDVATVEIDNPTVVTVEKAGQQGPSGPQGNVGPQGVAGPVGPPGPTGGVYEHHQANPSNVWVIPHNLGYRPAGALVRDTQGTEHETARREDPDLNTTVLYWDYAFGGYADLS